MSELLVDHVKLDPNGRARLTYRLKNANVFVSPRGFHFIDYLDPEPVDDEDVNASRLSEQEAAYIESQLQGNRQRFEKHVGLVKRYLEVRKAKVLDIGCGGGVFLSMIRDAGADVLGVELSDSRVHFARMRYGLDVVKRAIDHEAWLTNYRDHFDAVTLWDVIEHVNFPERVLRGAVGVLKPGGVVLIDTPCRDSFYHRVGVFTYRMTGGRLPTFLNAMYSAHMFGHKQIFSSRELAELFDGAGLEVLEVSKIHELSFPYEFYLKRMIRSELGVRLMLPLVRVFFALFKIRNKALVVGRKRAVAA